MQVIKPVFYWRVIPPESKITRPFGKGSQNLMEKAFKIGQGLRHLLEYNKYNRHTKMQSSRFVFYRIHFEFSIRSHEDLEYFS